MLNLKKGKRFARIAGIFILMMILASCSNNVTDDDNNNDNANYLLVIEEGARSIRARETITYTASLVDAEGNSTIQTSVNWTSSDENVATISNGDITVADVGTTTITANVSADGIEYSVSVPLAIRLDAPLPFTVIPGAVIAIVGEQIELETVNFTAETINPTYVSGNTNVASINSSGVVTANSVGFTEISVNYDDMTYFVPVLVVALPEIDFPVVNIDVSPESNQMFIGDTFQYSAEAMNSSSETVDIDIEWSSTDTAVATVDQDGNVTAISVGEVKIQASANGIIGEAECHILPDTVIIVNPFMQLIEIGSSYTFDAQAYSLKYEQFLPDVNDFYWFMPQYPPPFDQFFNSASVNQSGTVTVNFDAMPGMMGFAFVALSEDPDNPLGCGIYIVDMGFPNTN